MLVKVRITAEFESVYDDTEVLCPRTTALIDFVEKIVKPLDEHWSVHSITSKESEAFYADKSEN